MIMWFGRMPRLSPTPVSTTSSVTVAMVHETLLPDA
jgi:hypothetical protein